MIPTVEPPPPKPSNIGDPTTIPTIVDLAHNLHDLLFEIPLPKTRNAKMAPIALEALHHARDLITSVATLLHEHPRESNLSNISKQLDAVTTRLGTLNVAQVAQPLSPPKTQSYASVLATGIQCPELLKDPPPPPCMRAHFDLTLTQKSRNHPVLTELSSQDLSDRIYAALREADCWHEIRPISPDSEGSGELCLAPCIRAVGRHRSGNLWILVVSEAVRDMLIGSIHEWLPQLSDSLTYIPKTYPVLIHGMPTSFDTSHDSPNINALLDVNLDIILHPSTLQHVEFLICNPGCLQHKTHSSVVLHFMDPTVANDCIAHQVSLHGQLLSMVKFIRHPPRCYSCHQLGHFAQACKLKRACGLHMDTHDTRSCT